MPPYEAIKPAQSLEQPTEPLPDSRVVTLQSETESPVAQEAAFASIVHEFTQPLRRFVTSLSNSPDTAEDIVQETFIGAWQAVGRLEPRSTLTRWLVGIAHNQWLKELRDNKYHKFTGGAPAENIPSHRDDPIAQHEFHEVMASLEDVPETHRSALLLNASGYSCKDIAEIQAITPENAKIRLFRGRQAARQILEKSLPSEDQAPAETDS